MGTGSLRPKLGASDRTALIALGGVLLSLAAWLFYAYVDSRVLLEGTFEEVFLRPGPEQLLQRLVVIVIILLATLLVQTLYARRLRAESDLELERTRVVQMYQNSPDAVVCMDLDRKVTFVNPALRQMFPEQATADLLGEECFRVIWERDSPCDGCQALDVVRTRKARERTIHDRRYGLDRWLEKTTYPVIAPDGSVESLVEVTRDTTDRILALQTIEHMAFHDALTGLPNRALFHDRLKNAIAAGQRRGESLIVAFIDLDDFKTINDTLGHGVGDAVLKEVARRLAALVRDEDTVARQSGDEFTILARVSGVEDAAPLAERVLDCLADPVVVEGQELHVSASIGMALFPRDGSTDRDLLRNADTAMYCAKEWGHNVFRLYESSMSTSAVDRLGMENALRQAVARREFELFYQPQVDIVAGRFVGVEALLRWHHPSRGLLEPVEFIDVAEQAGLMSEIGAWVLHTACTQARDWVLGGVPIGRVGVNLSTREFVHKDVVHNVASILEETGLDPARLEIEITESTAMHDVEHVIGALRLLRSMGVRTAIDDFGIGYSSMSSLRRFPFDTLKIAQVFMADVHTEPHSSAIAGMLIDLCRELGLDVVAEGVENADQLAFLKRHDCRIIQGNLFSRPLPASRIPSLLSRGVQLPA